MNTKATARNGNVKQPRQEVSFTSGSIPKAILTFVGPFMLGIMVQNLYGAVDLFVVGRFATTADASAVTIGSQLMNIVTQLIIGFATGITMLIGKSFGAKDQKGLTRTTGVAVMIFSIAGVLLTAIYIIANHALVTVMRTPPEAIAATRQYLGACAVGIVFIVGYNVVTSILTGLGDSRTPFLFILVACFINIVLDVVFVKYIGMGALGAAIATTVAQAGSFLFSILFLCHKGVGFPLSKADIKLDRQQILWILKIGGPVAMQNILVGMSFLFISAIINQMGVVASAAVGVVEKLITFLMVPAIAMGTAVGTASSQNLGADQPDRARKCMWYGVLIALIPSIIIAVFCQFGSPLLTGLLTNDSAVVTMGGDYLRSYIWDCILVSFVFCMNGYFNSCGKSWFSLAHSLVTTFAVRVPMAYLLSRLDHTGLFMIGWAAPLSTLISLVLCMIFLAILRKKRI